MKKLIIIIILSISLFNCSSSDSNKVDSGFLFPDFTTAKDPLYTNKSYNFSDPTINESCTASAQCSAVYFSGTVNDVAYTGFAADAKMSGNSANDFRIKGYKSASDTLYTIKIFKNGTLYTKTDVDPGNMDIVDNGDGTFTIDFTSSISFGTLNISNGDHIVAAGVIE